MRFPRSYLFCPGDNPERAVKALTAGADAVILDLEDAVALEKKKQARETVGGILAGTWSCPLLVRVNGWESPHALADLDAIVGRGARAVVWPKAEEATQLLAVDWVLGQMEASRGIEKGFTGIIPLIENARGVENAGFMAGLPRVIRLAFGSLDYALDLGVTLKGGSEQLLYARSKIVHASRAAGSAAPVDTVYPGVRDLVGLETEAILAKDLGFGAKLLIHPAQIPVVHGVFSPTPEEVEDARRVVAAFQEAESRGLAAIQLEGRFIDYPVVKRARQLLDLAGEGGKD